MEGGQAYHRRKVVQGALHRTRIPGAFSKNCQLQIAPEPPSAEYFTIHTWGGTAWYASQRLCVLGAFCWAGAWLGILGRNNQPCCIRHVGLARKSQTAEIFSKNVINKLTCRSWLSKAAYTSSQYENTVGPAYHSVRAACSHTNHRSCTNPHSPGSPIGPSRHPSPELSQTLNRRKP